MPEVRIYTYGDEGNVMVKVGEKDVKMEQEGHFRRMGAFITVVPAAKKQLPKYWEKLQCFLVYALPLSDPNLRAHSMTLGEHLVIETQMPKETWKIVQDDEVYLKDESLDWLFNEPGVGVLTFVLAIDNPLDFPDQIQRWYDKKDPRNFHAIEPLMKLINGERILDGIPEKWLEDYFQLMLKNGDRDTQRAKEVREFIDTYDHDAHDEDGYR